MKEKLLELAILNTILKQNKINELDFYNDISYYLNDELSITNNLDEILNVLSKTIPELQDIDKIRKHIHDLEDKSNKEFKINCELMENIESLTSSLNNEKFSESISENTFYMINIKSDIVNNKARHLIPEILTTNNIDYVKSSKLLFAKINKEKIIELFKNNNNLKGLLTPKNFSKVYTDLYYLYNKDQNSVDFLKSKQEEYKIKNLIILNNNLILIDNNFDIEKYNKEFNEKVKNIKIDSFIDLNEIKKITNSYLNKNKIGNKL